jgi:excinuclease UvrABC nuclease subunit
VGDSGSRARYHWHVFFVTQRPDSAGETTQRQTERWLIQQGFELPTVVVMDGSRGRLADVLQLDVLVDDTRKHSVDVIAESKTKPMLVVRSGDAGTTTRPRGSAFTWSVRCAKRSSH